MMEQLMAMKLFDSVHEMSMSDDTWEAANGRCLKEFINGFDNWEAAEKKRGTERAVVVYAIMATCSIIAATTVLAAAKVTRRKEAMESATSTFCRICQELLQDAEEYSEGNGFKGYAKDHTMEGKNAE